MIHTNMHTPKAMGMELDWIEEYQWIGPPRLWEANSGKGWIQKWSHFQLDSLFSPRPYTKVMGKKQDGSLLFLYPTFWWVQKVLVLYSGPALWLWVIPIHYSYQWYEMNQNCWVAVSPTKMWRQPHTVLLPGSDAMAWYLNIFSNTMADI